MMTMIAADKFDDVLTAGISAGQTQCAHSSFGAAVDHADHFHRRHKLTEQLGKRCFRQRRRTVGRTSGGRLLNGCGDLRMSVP